MTSSRVNPADEGKLFATLGVFGDIVTSLVSLLWTLVLFNPAARGVQQGLCFQFSSTVTLLGLVWLVWVYCACARTGASSPHSSSGSPSSTRPAPAESISTCSSKTAASDTMEGAEVDPSEECGKMPSVSPKVDNPDDHKL